MSWQGSWSVSPSRRVKGDTPKTDNNLFFGLWLRWSALTVPERFVCANIVLIPLWWVVGVYRYMPTFMLMGIAFYEIRRYGKVRLTQPGAATMALFAFSTYRIVGSLLNAMLDNRFKITSFSRIVLFWYPLCLLLWYIQSNDIKVRLKPVAWACSVLALQMIGYWATTFFVLGEVPYAPGRTLFSMLSGNADAGYEAGDGLSNFLIPYRFRDRLPIGMFARWSFFFIIPEILGLVAGFIAMIALDLKNRIWSILLFVCSLFLLFLSGTRSVWLTLPLILALRYTFSFGRVWGYALPFFLIGTISFTTMSVPSVTQYFLETSGQSAESVGSARADSTNVRSEIYRRTIKEIPDKLILGHWKPGDIVLPGFELGRVGTHSFILGTLLYRLGLIGTGLFLWFWIAFALWLYQTRRGRPLCCFGLLILYTLASPVMEFGELIAWMILMLMAVIRSPQMEPS